MAAVVAPKQVASLEGHAEMLVGDRPGGQVAVTVSCTVSADGLELIDPPSTGPNTATAFAAIDPLRATAEAP